MNADALRRLRELFDQAVEVPSESREAWLGQQDISSEVRLQLEAQLQVLEAGARPLPDLSPQIVACKGLDHFGDPESIGPYRVLRRLGEGGMGVVYAAEQAIPMRRVVAIKRIRAELDTRLALRRFEIERRALEQLEHPCIARVLDAGEDGAPWFAMELCDGPSISDYCERNGLTVGDRIRLFLDVCRGLQHAHQRGVLHRDLKPSNLLVVEVDGEPVPKIIDFGIAKALHGDDAGEQTQAGIVLGTPAYMAPEQRGGGRPVDVRSDCYALGVVLFELLVGKPPPTAATSTGGVTPAGAPRPSAFIEVDTEAGFRIARQRSVDPQGLRRQLCGDLDRVLGTALAPDPEGRYGSVAAFADDLARVLRGAPVSVGPPSFAYRMRCFARQHRVALAASVLTLLAVLVGGGLAIHYAMQAESSLVATRSRQLQLYDALSRSFAEARVAGRQHVPGPRLLELNLDLLEESLPGFRSRHDAIRARQTPDRSAIVRTRIEEAQLALDVLGRLPPAARMAAADRLMYSGEAVMNLAGASAALPFLEASEAHWSAMCEPQDLRVLASRALLLDAWCAMGRGERAVRSAETWLAELRAQGFVETSLEIALLRSWRGLALRAAGHADQALAILSESVGTLGDSFAVAWTIEPRAALLEMGVGEAADRRSFAGLLCRAASWGTDHLRVALGPDRKVVFEALCAFERAVRAGSEADASGAFGVLVEAQKPPLPTECLAALSIWVGGIGAVCVSAFGWKSDLTEAVLTAAADGQRSLRDVAPERFAKSRQFLSGVLLAEERFDEAEEVILDALSVEAVLPRGDSGVATVLTSNTHWRLRGRLGACLAARGDLVGAHAHMLESWVALDELEQPGTGNAAHALRELARLHRTWDGPEAVRCREQTVQRLPPRLRVQWREIANRLR